MTPPIRFLALVVGGWAVVRGLSLVPGAGTAQDQAEAEPPKTHVPAAYGERLASGGSVNSSAGALRLAKGPFLLARRLAVPARGATASREAAGVPAILAGASPVLAYTTPLPTTRQVQPLAAGPPPLAEPIFEPALASLGARPVSAAGVVPAGRLSADAWMLARRGDGAGALAAGDALLGGSQVGARLLYRIAGEASAPLSLSARVSSPLRRNGTEAAIGVEWRPVARLPVRVLAERRQRVSGTGRSAFALLAHGGVSDLPVASGFRLDAYAQAGVVGAHRRDKFADGGATLVRPLGSDALGLAAGVGAWGGAQRGASRLDVGPRLTATIGAAGLRARVSLDWRVRVAGDAAPGSGPALTVATGF